MELAHWIANKSNPLTARVMVNRVWAHLFGQGLVETVDNFGRWATNRAIPNCSTRWRLQFMNEKWSVKKLIRSIVLSRTYQLSSEHNDGELRARSGEQAICGGWTGAGWTPKKFAMRCSMASGQIDLERPAGSLVMELGNGPVRTAARTCKRVRKATNVRSVYLPILRGIVPEMLQVFDAADPA